MLSVGIFEAKAQLSQLVERVAQGEAEHGRDRLLEALLTTEDLQQQAVPQQREGRRHQQLPDPVSTGRPERRGQRGVEREERRQRAPHEARRDRHVLRSTAQQGDVHVQASTATV